jgi:type I restriction enzyme R subunit
VRTVRKETMIFPRYHQLDAVRKLVAHAEAPMGLAATT